jgi:hypothetical protein
MEPISQPLPAPLPYTSPLDTMAGNNTPLTLTQALDKPKVKKKAKPQLHNLGKHFDFVDVINFF